MATLAGLETQLRHLPACSSESAPGRCGPEALNINARARSHPAMQLELKILHAEVANVGMLKNHIIVCPKVEFHVVAVLLHVMSDVR